MFVPYNDGQTTSTMNLMNITSLALYTLDFIEDVHKDLFDEIETAAI